MKVDRVLEIFKKSGNIDMPYYEITYDVEYYMCVTERCDWCQNYFNDGYYTKIYIPMLDVYVCKTCFEKYNNWNKLYKTRDAIFEEYNIKKLKEWLLDYHNIQIIYSVGYECKRKKI